jgi:molybdopterin molybdotransferase
MTGAKLPKGCEAVVPVEDVEENNGNVTLPLGVKKLANMRFSGEDLQKDSVIVDKNKKITPYDIGVLASQGYSYVSVFKRVRVGVLSSGEELQPHYATLKSGQLFNSNAPTLESLCRDLNCDVTSSLVVKDSFDGLKAAFANCLDCDVVVTTGGASVGDKDFTKDALKALGAKTVFEKIDIKPGKPTSLYNVKGCYVLVLPGNPLAAMVNFELCGKALIKQIENSKEKYFLQIKARVSKPFEKKGAKDTVVLGIFDGESFEALDLQLPGMVKPLQRANAFTLMQKEKKRLEADEDIKLFLLHSTLFSTKNQKILG